MWHPTKTCSLTVNMVMDQLTNAFKGTFFSDKPRVMKGLIKPCPLTIVVWRFKIKIL